MSQVMLWWYDWGLFLFMLLDLIAILWVILDSANRRTNALAWRLGAIFPTLLVLPSFFYKFSSVESRLEMAGLVEPFFWMGLLGGIVPIVLAIAYAFTAMARPAGPAYGPVPPPIYAPPSPPIYGGGIPGPVVQPPRPPKPKAGGWLYIQSGPAAGRSFQLNVGDTRIGRGPDNDIPLEDAEISKGHALIREQGGQFTIQDLGSTNGTYVNGQLLRAVQMLYDGDSIRMGQTTLVFKHA